jgi:hypothetical protein
MIRPVTRFAAVFSAILLAGCLSTEQAPSGTAMDGSWASSDGVFRASFGGGNFTSRFTKTNEVLAQGTYTVTGGQVAMQWLSVATQQQRSANCAFTGSNVVRCDQAGGGGFELRRTA